jgi:hypothetical protein
MLHWLSAGTDLPLPWTSPVYPHSHHLSHYYLRIIILHYLVAFPCYVSWTHPVAWCLCSLRHMMPVVVSLNVALSKGPNRAGVFLTLPEDGNRPGFRNSVFYSYVEFRKMDKVHSPSNSELNVSRK